MKLIGDHAGDDDSPARQVEVAPGQPTLADLASSVPMPGAGVDTLAASHAILAKLKEMQPDG